jgi:hypothetical protein
MSYPWYPASTLYGLTTSLAHDGGGIGAVMGEPQARELAEQADFGQFRKLPIEDPLYVLYELIPSCVLTGNSIRRLHASDATQNCQLERNLV